MIRSPLPTKRVGRMLALFTDLCVASTSDESYNRNHEKVVEAINGTKLVNAVTSTVSNLLATADEAEKVADLLDSTQRLLSSAKVELKTEKLQEYMAMNKQIQHFLSNSKSPTDMTRVKIWLSCARILEPVLCDASCLNQFTKTATTFFTGRDNTLVELFLPAWAEFFGLVLSDSQDVSHVELKKRAPVFVRGLLFPPLHSLLGGSGPDLIFITWTRLADALGPRILLFFQELVLPFFLLFSGQPVKPYKLHIEAVQEIIKNPLSPLLIHKNYLPTVQITVTSQFKPKLLPILSYIIDILNRQSDAHGSDPSFKSLIDNYSVMLLQICRFCIFEGDVSDALDRYSHLANLVVKYGRREARDNFSTFDKAFLKQDSSTIQTSSVSSRQPGAENEIPRDEAISAASVNEEKELQKLKSPDDVVQQQQESNPPSEEPTLNSLLSLLRNSQSPDQIPSNIANLVINAAFTIVHHAKEALRVDVDLLALALSSPLLLAASEHVKDDDLEEVVKSDELLKLHLAAEQAMQASNSKRLVASVWFDVMKDSSFEKERVMRTCGLLIRMIARSMDFSSISDPVELSTGAKAVLSNDASSMLDGVGELRPLIDLLSRLITLAVEKERFLTIEDICRALIDLISSKLKSNIKCNVIVELADGIASLASVDFSSCPRRSTLVTNELVVQTLMAARETWSLPADGERLAKLRLLLVLALRRRDKRFVSAAEAFWKATFACCSSSLIVDDNLYKALRLRFLKCVAVSTTESQRRPISTTEDQDAKKPSPLLLETSKCLSEPRPHNERPRKRKIGLDDESVDYFVPPEDPDEPSARKQKLTDRQKEQFTATRERLPYFDEDSVSAAIPKEFSDSLSSNFSSAAPSKKKDENSLEDSQNITPAPSAVTAASVLQSLEKTSENDEAPSTRRSARRSILTSPAKADGESTEKESSSGESRLKKLEISPARGEGTSQEKQKAREEVPRETVAEMQREETAAEMAETVSSPVVRRVRQLQQPRTPSILKRSDSPSTAEKRTRRVHFPFVDSPETDEKPNEGAEESVIAGASSEPPPPPLPVEVSEEGEGALDTPPTPRTPENANAMVFPSLASCQDSVSAVLPKMLPFQGVGLSVAKAELSRQYGVLTVGELASLSRRQVVRVRFFRRPALQTVISTLTEYEKKLQSMKVATNSSPDKESEEAEAGGEEREKNTESGGNDNQMQSDGEKEDGHDKCIDKNDAEKVVEMEQGVDGGGKDAEMKEEDETASEKPEMANDSKAALVAAIQSLSKMMGEQPDRTLALFLTEQAQQMLAIAGNYLRSPQALLDL